MGVGGERAAKHFWAHFQGQFFFFLQLTFLTVNPDSVSPSYIFVQEVGSGAAACPKGMYCLHASSTNEDDDDTIDRLIIRDVSKKVWSLQFKVWEIFII